jgi:hypothetical protein
MIIFNNVDTVTALRMMRLGEGWEMQHVWRYEKCRLNFVRIDVAASWEINFIFVGCILLRYLRILYEHIIYICNPQSLYILYVHIVWEINIETNPNKIRC